MPKPSQRTAVAIVAVAMAVAGVLGVVGLDNHFFWDDEATTAIGAGIPPFSGRFRPEGLLASFNGEAPDGVWTLEITDDQGGGVGTLDDWSLTITTWGAEPSRVTNAYGYYEFTGLPPGTYVVAEAIEDGWEKPIQAAAH